MILMTFMIICSSSCQFIPPMPKFQTIEICPPVFIPIDSQASIYKVHCRCALYDPVNAEWLNDFEPAPIDKCDRAFGIVTEDFKAIFEPDMAELQEWYDDWREKEEKVNKIMSKKYNHKI